MGIFDFIGKQTELPRPDPRLIEAVRLIDAQAAAISHLEKELKIRDEKIEFLSTSVAVNFKEFEEYSQGLVDELDAKDRLLEEHKKQEASLIKEIYRLRAELKKRTDQYNDLVDLAREHKII